MIKLNNEILCYEKIVDCNQVALRLEFSHVTNEKTSAIYGILLKSILPLFLDDCFVEFIVNNRKVRMSNLARVLREIEMNEKQVECFVCEFHVKNEFVTEEFHREYAAGRYVLPPNPHYDTDELCGHIAPDYRALCEEAFNSLEYRDAIKKILCADRTYLNAPFISDFRFLGITGGYSYQKDGELMSVISTTDRTVEFYICIKKHIIGDSIDELLEIYEGMIDKLAGMHSLTNATIGLFPNALFTCTSHDYCFSGWSVSDRFEEIYLAHDWFFTNYLMSAEWLTVISAQAMRHLKVSDLKACDKVDVYEYSNGAVKVKMKKHLYDVTVQDMYEIKKLLYPALKPGYHHFIVEPQNKMTVTNLAFRKLWEFMPLFDSEMCTLSNADMHPNATAAINKTVRHLYIAHKPEICLRKEAQELFYKHQWKSWD